MKIKQLTKNILLEKFKTYNKKEINEYFKNSNNNIFPELVIEYLPYLNIEHINKDLKLSCTNMEKIIHKWFKSEYEIIMSQLLILGESYFKYYEPYQTFLSEEEKKEYLIKIANIDSNSLTNMPYKMYLICEIRTIITYLLEFHCDHITKTFIKKYSKYFSDKICKELNKKLK